MENIQIICGIMHVLLTPSVVSTSSQLGRFTFIKYFFNTKKIESFNFNFLLPIKFKNWFGNADTSLLGIIGVMSAMMDESKYMSLASTYICVRLINNQKAWCAVG